MLKACKHRVTDAQHRLQEVYFAEERCTNPKPTQKRQQNRGNIKLVQQENTPCYVQTAISVSLRLLQNTNYIIYKADHWMFL